MEGFLLVGLALSAVGTTTAPLLKKGAGVGVTVLLFTMGLKSKVKNLPRKD